MAQYKIIPMSSRDTCLDPSGFVKKNLPSPPPVMLSDLSITRQAALSLTCLRIINAISFIVSVGAHLSA